MNSGQFKDIDIMKMGDLMQQAQQFQQKLADIQQELGGTPVTGDAG